MNSQKSKKDLQKKKPKEEEIEEELEDEETEEEADVEDETDEEEDAEEEEAEEEIEEETPAAAQPKKYPEGISKETQEALKRRNEEINLLHNSALFRYELLSQLLEINESLKKFLALLTPKKDGKGKQ